MAVGLEKRSVINHKYPARMSPKRTAVPDHAGLLHNWKRDRLCPKSIMLYLRPGSRTTAVRAARSSSSSSLHRRLHQDLGAATVLP